MSVYVTNNNQQSKRNHELCHLIIWTSSFNVKTGHVFITDKTLMFSPEIDSIHRLKDQRDRRVFSV